MPDSGRAASAIRPGVMIGRDDELRRGTELARDAAAGRGGLLLIQGEPGIGKTVLLRTILDEAAGLIPHVVTGAADEFDQRLPFATLHSCLQPWEQRSAQAAKVLGLIKDGSTEYPVIEAFLTLVEEWCVASPVAVAIEDLHWADPASILLLRRLGKVAGQLPLLLAATVRSGSGRRDVNALADSWRDDVAAIQLAPLPDLAVLELIRRLAGGKPGPALWEIVTGAAGNPLYISELLTGLARDGRLRAEDDMVDIGTGAADIALPSALGEAITGRLAVLSPGTCRLLQVAAVPRRYRGRDVHEWTVELGLYDQPTETITDPAQFREPHPMLSGARGGHTVSYQQLARDGVRLLGRLADIDGERLRFGPELPDHIEYADRRAAQFRRMVDDYVARTGITAPEPDTDPAEHPLPGAASSPDTLSLRAERITTVIWCVGFGPDAGWLRAPVFGSDGSPAHRRGITALPGLYVAGYPWLSNRGSGILYGVAADAARIAQHIASDARVGRAEPTAHTPTEIQPVGA